MCRKMASGNDIESVWAFNEFSYRLGNVRIHTINALYDKVVGKRITYAELTA